MANDRPVLSSERAPHIKKPATDSNKNLVVNPRGVLCSKTDWPTDRWSNITLTLTEDQNTTESGRRRRSDSAVNQRAFEN
jgi:hypothetical protein